MSNLIIPFFANMGVQTTAPFTNTYSLDFDGIDDYIDCGNGALDITSSITLSCWVKSTNTGSNRKIIVKDDAGSNRSFQININHPSLGPYTYFWLGGGNIKSVSTGIPNQIVDGNWHHVVSVFKSGQYIRMYIDGVQAANTNVTETTLDSSNTNFLIGTDGYGGTVGIDGAVDEVSVFDSALDSIEIASLYNGGVPTDLTSLSPVAWYRMGDNGSYKSPQWLLPNNENKDKVSNYSFDFDGVDDYISVSDNSIGQTQNISYSIWINLDVTTRQYIIGNQNSSTGGCGLQIESGDVLVFQMGDGTNDSFFNSRVASFSTYAPINTWNHILATWDGTDSKIYINGVLRNTWSPTLPYTISGYDTTFNIGWRNAGFSLMTNGKLDELALFDSAISIGDVWDGSGQPIDVSAVSGLTNNWRMGEEATFSGGVWTVPDAIGSNNGTSNAMTIEDRVGDAPNSENNALSYNMDLVDRTTDVPT
jgi:hypothetical protein